MLQVGYSSPAEAGIMEDLGLSIAAVVSTITLQQIIQSYKISFDDDPLMHINITLLII